MNIPSWTPRTALKTLFGSIFVVMFGITVTTSLKSNLFEVLPGMLDHPWTAATLWDAYLGFVIFYVWVAYKESTLGGRIVWFLLIMGLGNIATSCYVLLQLFHLPKQAPVEALLLRS
ncbi:MAG: DUF1475 domain-containing protein [Acidimicrobiia bacterium]|nr:DUF1475 domain-containing protein [Acidimicrobiia bacterium]